MGSLITSRLHTAGYTLPMERLNDILAQLDVLVRYEPRGACTVMSHSVECGRVLTNSGQTGINNSSSSYICYSAEP